MLRLDSFVCVAVLVTVTHLQPISEPSNTSELEIHSSEAEAPIKNSDNVEHFMNDHAEAIRKIISEQEFAVTSPALRQSSQDEHQPMAVDNNRQNSEELDDETKAKCKYYYELFQQKYEEIQNQRNQENRYKDIGSGIDEDKLENFGEAHINNAKIEPDVAQTNEYNVKVNNFDVQNLPYPERQFFNTNPDKALQKPNAKGPIPETIPIFVNNGYQYVPLTEETYLQPPYELKPDDFNKNHQHYAKFSPLTLQSSLISDGKMMYFWYKTLPNYQIYLPMINTNSNKNEKKISEIYEESSTATSTTSTTEATTTTTEIITEKPNKVEETQENLYAHQLKFVFPIQFPKPDVVNVPSYGVDPYAYYPREFQPDFMNVQVPYIPTFHMINRLTVPNKYSADVSLHEPTNMS